MVNPLERGLGTCCFCPNNQPKDVDEYVHMTGGHIFAGGVVPKDYLRTAWDSIVRYNKAEKKKIQTIKFYRWGMDNKLNGYFRT